MMTLDEAIEHCKEKSCGNSECALEHKQLAEWLTELKGLRVNDRVQKIRNEVERLKKKISNGATCGQYSEETIRKTYQLCNSILSFIDTMQEEPKECMYSKDNYTDEDRKALCDGCEEDCKYNKKEAVNDNCLLNEPSIPDIVDEHFYEMLGEETVSIWYDASKKCPLTGKGIIVLRDNKIYYGKYIGGFHHGYARAELQLTDDIAQTYAIIDYLMKKDKWIYVEDLQNLYNSCNFGKKFKEEPVSEDLEKEIDSYFAKWLQGASDEGCFNPVSQLVSIYDCHRIARHFAKWQKQKDMVIFNELAELANHQDGCYALEAIQMRLNGIINED